MKVPLWFEPEPLTLNLQVLLGLEVFDRRVVHDADHRHAVVLPADGEGQAAGDGVHLVVAQLHSGLPCRVRRDSGDVRTCSGDKQRRGRTWRAGESQQSSERSGLKKHCCGKKLWKNCLLFNMFGPISHCFTAWHAAACEASVRLAAFGKTCWGSLSKYRFGMLSGLE